jgi:arylsulfatase A-like enzyme
VTEPASNCDSPVISTDFYPTLLQLAGQPLKPEQHLDGVSFVPLLKGGSTARGKPLFWHYPHYANQGGPPNTVIREGDWKLVHWFGDYLDTTGFTPDDKPYGKLVVGPRTEVFNLREDPYETRNIAADRPKKTTHLTNALKAWLNRTKAKLPTPNSDFNEKRWWMSAGKPEKGEN